MNCGRRHRMLLSLLLTAACVAVASVSAEDNSGVGPTDVASVLARMSSLGSERPEICIRGVVTLAVPDRVDFAVQDATGGIWVTAADVADASLRAALKCGHEVEVRGLLDRGGFAPLLLARDLRILGDTPLPEPLVGDVMRLFIGADNCRRVELTIESARDSSKQRAQHVPVRQRQRDQKGQCLFRRQVREPRHHFR